MTDQTKQNPTQRKPTEYTCPKCGSPVQHTVLYSYPGKDKYECTRCDYLKVIPQAAFE